MNIKIDIKELKADIIHILKNHKIDKEDAEDIAYKIISLFDSDKESQYAEIFIDGGSRGNPGEGASACIIYQNNKKIYEGGRFHKRTTNNEAEYNALIFALNESLRLRLKHLRVFTDSELLSRQITKIYAVKSPSLLALYNKVIMLTEQFKGFSITHIPRERNSEADRLANIIMDKRKDISIYYNE